MKRTAYETEQQTFVLVKCADGEVRHNMFLNVETAQDWADNGHFCLQPHTYIISTVTTTKEAYVD